MTMTDTQFFYLAVPRAELADALRGDLRNRAASMQGRTLPRISNKEVIVFWTLNSRRPCIIAVSDSDRDELYNWATTFQRDLSPLTSWCHVLSARETEKLTTTTRLEADLSGTEAAWAGAAVAEAMVLSRRSYETISLPSCLATETFAVARTAALYGVRGIFSDTTERLARVRDRLKRSERAPAPHAATPILLRLLPDAPPVATRAQELLVSSCKMLQSSSQTSQSTSQFIFRAFGSLLPVLIPLETLDEISAEQRVKLLRDMPLWIANCKSEDERQIMTFAAGYIISRVGGAERDLRLAEGFGSWHPHVLTWAAVIGGLGATTYWSDAFGGIGRLVARELSRSLDLTDPPTADISADEFLVINGLESGPTKLRTALRQVATISVRPGVVVQLSISDDDRSGRPEEAARIPPPSVSLVRERQESRHLETLAEQLFPYIRNLLIRAGFEQNHDKRSPRKGKPPQLPLK
jgi:hypothetical protein